MSHSLLENIISPKDLKNLSIDQLNSLAEEIRQKIIEVLSENGGHLASNLGIIELTIALHKVFNSPNDKLIFDTSHQSYVHKILTGRYDLFNTICLYKGLSGFSNPNESVHDHFHIGHAGVAISLALGMAKKRDLSQTDEYVIPIIGDASLTCGVTLEALNNFPRNLKNFIIILNDNKMAISPNVGAIKQILSRIINHPTTNKILIELDSIISKIPRCGNSLSEQSHKITESLKHLVSPATYFEHFGLSYVGPINGHHIKDLIDTLEGVKNINKPVIVHVLTKKGKGLLEAMASPTTHHGAKPFDPTTGKFLPSASRISFPKIFGEHILKMATEDPSIVAITPAMSFGSCLDPFMKKFPNRCIDVGIAEAHSVTFSGGMAHNKQMKVFSVIYATFLQRALDNLFHDVCLQKLPVVFAVDRAGLASYGATHHGIYDISFLNAMPNLVITQPRNGQLLIELIESAFSWNRPTVIRYPNLATEHGTEPLTYRSLGHGEIIAKGSEVLIIGIGHMCDTAMHVRKILQNYGITATVLDPIFLKPLDSELLCNILLEHKYLVTIEEHSLSGGASSIINNFLMRYGYANVQVINFGIPDAFIGHGSRNSLLEELDLTPEKIAKKMIQQFALTAKSLT